MSLKIIIGYLRLLERVRRHYQLEHLAECTERAVDWQSFSKALDGNDEQGFDIDTYVRLLRQMQTVLARPVSLILAEHATLQDVGLMGYLASTSLNLQQALLLLEQYYSLIFKQTNVEQLKIIEHDQEIQVSWGALWIDYREVYELNQALIFKIAQIIVQEPLVPPTQVQLGFLPTLPLMHYSRFYHCAAAVVSGDYRIYFSERVLKARSFGADQQLNQILSNQAQQSLRASDSLEYRQQQLKQRIWGLIAQAFREKNEILQAYVAQQMHISERTLQRHLKQHALNFQEIVDEFRLQQSQLYLKQSRQLSEIAELLGYADQSAFGRAFKRWTGETPKQFRDRHRVNSATHTSK
ncbi:helix-turn-helix domain-containing protein [Acinetobacter soli]|uniref:helix-turn-helix domain-containing protein n=1 Tax=Acinetobacter soli TaxID=487316 RepID=UPI00124F9989|nr:helix-turn-helix transcriptional regulator [Acinetobacter soli]MDQ9831585.1 helix-turn-helix transcriptional regulator [Acinetobacter soli]